MNRADLENYIHQHIPLSRGMGVQVASVSADRLELFAPLAPNLNHRGSAFGGSLSALAMLAGWGMCRYHADGLEPMPNLVIARSEMDFTKVGTSDLTAVCSPEPGQMADFLDRLVRKGRARTDLVSILLSDGDEIARMRGVYAAVSRSRS